MREILDFLRRLHDNNDREWFDAHRAEWGGVKRRIASLAERLIDGIASFDASVRGLRVQDCTYRIARDTRFSADKSPYKEWVGIFVAPHGKKSGYAGYYLHIAPCGDRIVGGHMLISGLYCPDSVLLRSLRDEILDNGAQLRQTVLEAEGFRLNRDNVLKRTPVGYPAGSEFDDLLRLKDFCLEQPVAEEFLLADDLVERAVGEFRRTQPFIEILNRAVQYANEEMR